MKLDKPYDQWLATERANFVDDAVRRSVDERLEAVLRKVTGRDYRRAEAEREGLNRVAMESRILARIPATTTFPGALWDGSLHYWLDEWQWRGVPLLRHMHLMLAAGDETVSWVVDLV